MSDTPTPDDDGDIPPLEPVVDWQGAPPPALTDGELRAWAQREEFLDRIRRGAQPMTVAFSIGWSPARMRRELADPAFRELYEDAQRMSDEPIIDALRRTALAGNVAAQQMWLYNRRPSEWRDVKRIEVNQTATVEIQHIVAVKGAVLQLLEEHGADALQIGSGLDEDDIVDAEVVERGDT